MAQGQHDVDMASAKMCIFMLFSNTPSQLPPPKKKVLLFPIPTISQDSAQQ